MALVTKSFSDIITFSRNSNAMLFDSTGTLVWAPNNHIRNNTMQGAVAGTPGTLPQVSGSPSWNVSGLGTLTREVVGTGTTANGIAYIDLRFSGTTSTLQLSIRLEPNGTGAIAAANGQTWAMSMWSAIVAGSLTNITGGQGYGTLLYDAAGAFIGAPFSSGVLNTTSTLVRTQTSGTIATAGAAFIQPQIYFLFNSGVAIDITIRIGMPQLELGSTATVVNATSGTAYFGPRLDYNPITLAAQGLLIEEQRTNLCLQSADLFENGTGGVNWIWPAGVVTGNTQTAPDGTTTADTITTTGGAQSVYQSVTVTASTSYTFSVFVKLGTMSVSDYKIAFYNNIAATFIASDIVPTQVPNTSSWTRISYTFTTPVGCTSIRVYPFRNAAPITSSTVFIWGAQLEAGAFPTSYIPTTVASATRNADVASVNTLSPWFNASEGTLFGEITDAAITVSGTSRRIANINDGTEADRITVGWAGAISVAAAFVTDNSVGQASFTSPSGAYPFPTKVALAYKAADFQAAVNGSAFAAVSSGTVPTVNRMTIGDVVTGSSGLQNLNGHVRRITYYPRRLSQAELTAITA